MRALPNALVLLARTSLLDMLLLKLCHAYRVMRAEGLIWERHKEMMSSLRQIEICICFLGLVGLSQEQIKAELNLSFKRARSRKPTYNIYLENWCSGRDLNPGSQAREARILDRTRRPEPKDHRHRKAAKI